MEVAQVTWCFTPIQPVRLYQGEWMSRDSGKNLLVVRCLFVCLFVYCLLLLLLFGLVCLLLSFERGVAGNVPVSYTHLTLPTNRLV